MGKKKITGMVYTNNERITHLVIPFIYLLMLSGLSSVSSAFSQSNLQGTDNPGSRTLKQEDPPVHEVHCSRERSRAAWNIIDQYLMPFVEKEKYQLSSQCRLNASNDLFRDQEEHKIHYDANEWRCGYCKKIFRAEKYLDQHFDNRHSNLLNSNGKCLADVCGALHCDLMMDSKPRKSKCNPAAAAKNRHLCESLADSCFPVNQGHSAIRLHEAHKRVLFSNFDLDNDAAPYILPYCLFVPKRNAKGHTRTQAHLKNWTKNKAIVMVNLFHRWTKMKHGGSPELAISNTMQFPLPTCFDLPVC